MNAPECAENAPEPPRFVQIRWHVFPLSNLHICKKAAEEITTEVLCQFYRFYKPHVHVMYFTFEKGIPTCCVYDFYESWRAVLQFPMLSDLCFSQSNLFPYLSTKCFCECMKACWHHICIITPIFPRVQWSRKLFRACRTKCPAGLQRSAGHFEPLSYIFPSWWLANISGHSCFPCRTFYVYWTLLEKNVRHGLSSLPDISRSLPDMSGMSGIFRDHWYSTVQFMVAYNIYNAHSIRITIFWILWPWPLTYHLSYIFCFLSKKSSISHQVLVTEYLAVLEIWIFF